MYFILYENGVMVWYQRYDTDLIMQMKQAKMFCKWVQISQAVHPYCETDTYAKTDMSYFNTGLFLKITDQIIGGPYIRKLGKG